MKTVDKIKLLFEQGNNIKQIASSLSITEAYVRMNLPSQKKGTRQKVLQLINMGLSKKEIASVLKISLPLVYRYAK